MADLLIIFEPPITVRCRLLGALYRKRAGRLLNVPARRPRTTACLYFTSDCDLYLELLLSDTVGGSVAAVQYDTFR